MANRMQRQRIDRTGHRQPADHRRKRAGRAADDDVLRGAPLQPHRIDKHVEHDRQGQRRGGGEVHRQPHHDDRADRKRDAEAQRRTWLDAARGDRPVPRSPHHRVDVTVIPHVDRAARAGGDGDAQHRGQRQHRVQMAGCDQQADEPGEHHQRHHARLQQGEPVAELGCLVVTASLIGISECAAVPRRCGTVAGRTRSTPASWHPRPSSYPLRAPSR